MHGQKLYYCYKAVPKTIVFFLSLYVTILSFSVRKTISRLLSVLTASVFYISLFFVSFFFFLSSSGCFFARFTFFVFQFSKYKMVGKWNKLHSQQQKKVPSKKKTNRTDHLFFHFSSIFHFLTGFNALLLLLLPLSYSHTYYNHLVHLSLGLSQSGWESLDRQTRADTTAHTAS